MGAPDIFGRLAAAGIELSRIGDKLIATPRESLDDDLRALIRDHKPELMAALGSSTHNNERDELDRLIAVVARFNAFTEADIQEARTIAFGDIPAALVCFRDLAKRAVTPKSIDDDRVLCADCSNLRRGHCRAAAQGLMADTYAGYSPVPDVLRRCEHFKKKAI